jgi:exodeoxyribonuclease VII small subunit
MSDKEFDYSKAKTELQDIVSWFEQGDPNLDEALAKYKKAEELIINIEKYLEDMEKQLKITIHNK